MKHSVIRTDRMTRNRCNRETAFTRIELVVVVVIVAVLIAVLLPALVASKKKGCRINCTNNLKQIGLAFRQWSLDNGDKFPMQVSVTNGGTMELIESGNVFVHFRVLSNELNTPKILVCPDDGRTREKAWATLALARKTNVGYNNPFPTSFPVSYFAGANAQPDRPKMFLSGDDNFEIGGVPVKSGLLELSTNASVAWTSARHKTDRRHSWNATTNFGYVGLVDGSVQTFSRERFQQALAETGLATNRLAMP
jgi:type II secretory pathway pseudopilin PulG